MRISQLSRTRILLASATLMALTACGGGSPGVEETPYVEKPAETLFEEAVTELERGREAEAVRLFEEIERQHPYSPLAVEAQLRALETLYEDRKYDQAVRTAERFIALNPGHPKVDYAYYLRGLAYYDQIADIGRDQSLTETAQQYLEEVVRRFPDSEYAREAQFRLDLVRDHLAGKEMEVGRFYLQRGDYNAAINRFRNVIEDYQTTSHTAEALHRLVESYLALGLVGEAQTAAAVLGHNFPGSDWYRYSYALLGDPSVLPEAEEASWLTRAFRSVFRD